MTEDRTSGCRVLVVEDEAVVSLDIEDILKAMGCEILGPTGRLDAALELATNGDPDAAILDVMIRGGRVFPVAERLIERDIPFVLASGYGDWALPQKFQNLPRLTKPYTNAELEEQIRRLCEEASRRKRKRQTQSS